MIGMLNIIFTIKILSIILICSSLRLDLWWRMRTTWPRFMGRLPIKTREPQSKTHTFTTRMYPNQSLTGQQVPLTCPVSCRVKLRDSRFWVLSLYCDVWPYCHFWDLYRTFSYVQHTFVGCMFTNSEKYTQSF